MALAEPPEAGGFMDNNMDLCNTNDTEMATPTVH